MDNNTDRFSITFTFGQGTVRATRINTWLINFEQVNQNGSTHNWGTHNTDNITDKFSREYKGMVLLQHEYEKQGNGRWHDA